MWHALIWIRRIDSDQEDLVLIGSSIPSDQQDSLVSSIRVLRSMLESSEFRRLIECLVESY